jgi:hypothetical protein
MLCIFLLCVLASILLYPQSFFKLITKLTKFLLHKYLKKGYNNKTKARTLKTK